MKMAKRVPYIEQMEHSECGLACLGMVLCFYGFNITLPEIRDQFGSSKKGTSLQNLIEMGRFYHLEGKVYKAEAHSLDKVQLPAIIYWENKHFVVLEQVCKNYAVIVDPAVGSRKVGFDELIKFYSGYVLTMLPTDAFITKDKKSRFNFLLLHVFKYKKFLLTIVLVSFLLQGIGLLIPKFTQWVTDDVIIPRNQDYIPLIGISVLFLFIFHQGFALVRGYLISRLQTVMDYSLMSDFITKLFNLHYSFFENRTSGDLIYRANSNVFIRQILSNRAIALLIDLVLIIGFAVMMFLMNVQLGLLVMALCLIILLSIVVSSKWIKAISDKNYRLQTKTQGYLAESIHGISDIKVLGAEEKVFAKWNQLFQNQLKVSQKQSFLSFSLDSFSNGVQFITPLILLWLGAGFVTKGELTLGELLGFSSLAVSFMAPIVSVGSSYSQFLLLGAYIQRLQDVVDSTPESSSGEELGDFKGEIEMENLSFRYDHFGKHTLCAINLHIKPGEKIAIVGESGSGKSTLAKLILGLYAPSEGSLEFDGKRIEQLNVRSLRENFGAVLQESRLFHGTILENITLLNENLPVEDVIKAAHLADIHEEILRQPLGYHTMISEGGSNFSGGQRQRLLLARALANNPKVLILDEATSALDNLSESRVQDHLNSLDCTQIIIAHRLSTVINTDKIIVMENGEIKEVGSHEELLRNKNLYYNLYNKKEKKNEEMVI
ncbi:peptidase domain-containing ABC transporter [Neobacillus mesonae]|uniref:peptidase domain-containing ABC transporter n=1 Tax=Neobacillus mesonae TaxID=1193713 RepID=UPI002E205281|nr:peptidase domain-containing ABC transporter [Neobacillus mesonae]